MSEPSRQQRVLFVSSSGGHLSQLLQLQPWWANHKRLWVTFDLPDAHSKLEGEDTVFAHYPTTRNIKNLIRNTPLARKTIKQFKPDVIVSNGAGVAVPFFLLAKIMKIPTVYFEVYDRIDSKTLTGRICEPLSTKFLVQWPQQQALYKDSELIGAVY